MVCFWKTCTGLVWDHALKMFKAFHDNDCTIANFVYTVGRGQRCALRSSFILLLVCINDLTLLHSLYYSLNIMHQATVAIVMQ